MKAIVVLLSVITAAAVLAAQAPEQEPTPMMVEIQAAFDAAQAEVADLKARCDANTDPVRALELRREAARVKREVRVEIMRIQLRYARQGNNHQLVAELEQIITNMTTPPAKGVPAIRRGQQ